MNNQAHPSRADDELVYYKARPGWQWIDFTELWRFRELIWTFAQRDLKIRYRQTVVGVLWAILQPLMNMMIFAVFFSLLNKQPASREVPYAITCLCGLIPWYMFSGTVTAATVSIVQNQNILQKVYFPRIVLPLSSLIPPLVDFVVAFCLLLILTVVYRVPLTPQLFALPLVIAALLLVSLAAALWLSALNAIYRDVQHMVPFLLQTGMFISPVIYEASAIIPEKWRWLYSLNPLVGTIELFRWAVLGLPSPAISSLIISLSGTTVLLIGGLFYFRRMERFFSDRI